ncbi:hypothetical protein BRD00_10565 [Halobacteriales archaeon QS_8_69_26]|nr:MAG: hypothetical protein BRD00_10565 [Halobacteriales archaeon QS_8_69_26]
MSGVASVVLLAPTPLVLAVFGVPLATPLVVPTDFAWAAGSATAFPAIGNGLVGREDGWLKPLLVGAGINGLLALTGVGAFISFGVGAVGFGAVLKDWAE